MICIVIPTYNEKENIFNLISKILDIIPDVNIVVVDDSDKKIDLFKDLSKVNYIFRGKKLGRGSAVLEGFKFCLQNKKIKTFIEMDADFSHNPDELKNHLNHFYEKKLNFLIASRYLKSSQIKNWPLSRHLLSKLSNILARLLLRVPIKDYTNGFRFYDRKATEYIVKKCEDSKSLGFILLSEIALELYKGNFKIAEVPTIFFNRERGESKVNFIEIFLSFVGLIKLYLKQFSR